MSVCVGVAAMTVVVVEVVVEGELGCDADQSVNNSLTLILVVYRTTERKTLSNTFHVKFSFNNTNKRSMRM